MLEASAAGYPTAFVVASAAFVEALRKRLCDDPTIAVYAESESLDVLRAILARPPKLLALDPSVVRTSRGALLVSRLKEHAVDLRVLLQDESNIPVLLSQPDVALQAASQPLEGCGTRTAPRFPIKNIVVVVDGERSQLVNLSVSGAQVVLPARVQPRQSIRFILVDEGSETRFRGQIAWSALELGASAIRYRAGIAFTDPDTKILEVFCHRHGRQGRE
jgi:PilZ domain-containing protein